MTRINNTETWARCWRSDHDIARIINAAREGAHEKHGDNSIEAIPFDDPRWLSILVEEVGEVAHALTYDSEATPQQLAGELIDVMAVAAAWYDALRVAGLTPRPKVWTVAS